MISEPQCYKRGCVHFLGVKNDGDESSERVICKAFPEGIPSVIAYENNLHVKPYPGDGGIQYEQG
jgi:hypothetical protein